MIIVNGTSIYFLGLPLDSKEQVRRKDNVYKKAKKKVKSFEKRYGLKSINVCRYFTPKSPVFGNVSYDYIEGIVRIQWVENYEIIVASSYTYKFFIFLKKLIPDLELQL